MCHCFHWLWCKYSICHFVETQVRSQCVWYCDSEQGCVIDTRAVLVMSLWSNFSVINWVVWSVCVFSLCFGTCAQYTSKFTPAAYRVIVFLFLFVSLFMLRRSTGTSSSSPDFCQLRFQGLAHMESWFQSLLHLTWFQSPFPADLAGFWARPSLQDSPDLDQAGALGSEEMRGNEGKKANEGVRAWKWVFTHLCSPSLTYNFLSFLIASSCFISFYPVTILYSCLVWSNLVNFWFILPSHHLLSSFRFLCLIWSILFSCLHPSPFSFRFLSSHHIPSSRLLLFPLL